MTAAAIRDKVVVITGASSGLGRGTALQLAASGANLVLAARRAPLLESLVIECEHAGGKAIAVATDVSDKDNIERLADVAITTFGHIDVWINNAGVGALGVFTDVPLADHERILSTNLLGTLYGSYTAMARFRVQGFGTLINVASMLGKIPSPFYAAYNASKHGIIGLTHTIKHEVDELKLEHIHICLVLPMAMNTPFFEHAANYTTHQAVPIPPVTDVQHGIDAIAKLVASPRNDVIVGIGGSTSQLAHQMAPSLVEQMTAKMVHVTQDHGHAIDTFTSGNLYEPSTRGAGVYSDATKTN